MKNLKFIFASLLMVSMVLVSCKGKDPVVLPDEELDYPELVASAGKIIIAAKFETEPCNDVVFIGTHVGWDASDVSKLPKFTPVGTVDGKEWEGWYKVEVSLEDAADEIEGVNYVLAGKPVQLDSEGKFDWSYQVGYDEESDVVVKSGDVDVYEGYAGECDIFYASNEPIAIIFSKWKKDPCVGVAKHDYTFTVTVPEGTPSEADIFIVGDFKGDYSNWTADAEEMKLTKQSNGTYTITLNDVAEGTEYKYVLNGSWDYEELAAIEDGADCAEPINNRKTGSSKTIADKVENWRGVTAERCE